MWVLTQSSSLNLLSSGFPGQNWQLTLDKTVLRHVRPTFSIIKSRAETELQEGKEKSKIQSRRETWRNENPTGRQKSPAWHKFDSIRRPITPQSSSSSAANKNRAGCCMHITTNTWKVLGGKKNAGARVGRCDRCSPTCSQSLFPVGWLLREGKCSFSARSHASRLQLP